MVNLKLQSESTDSFNDNSKCSTRKHESQVSDIEHVTSPITTGQFKLVFMLNYVVSVIKSVLNV